jgi:hypothetical protein
MKMLSTMLYNDVDTCAMIEGRAYRSNRVDSLSVPNDNGENCAFITATKVQKKYLYYNRYSDVKCDILQYAYHRVESHAAGQSAPIRYSPR